MGEQKDHAESTHEGTQLAGEMTGGDLQFRWAETFFQQPFLQEVRRRWQNMQAPQQCLLLKTSRESLFILLEGVRGNSTFF